MLYTHPFELSGWGARLALSREATDGRVSDTCTAAELNLADLTMTVTVDGITTETVRAGTWAGHWTIATSRLHGNAFPALKRSQGGDSN